MVLIDAGEALRTLSLSPFLPFLLAPTTSHERSPTSRRRTKPNDPADQTVGDAADKSKDNADQQKPPATDKIA